MKPCRWRHALLSFVVLAFGLAASEIEVDPSQPYRFVVHAEQGRIRGLIRVDGVTRLVDAAESPFEFKCERASVISGYFEPMKKGSTLRLAVYDPQYKRGRAKSLTLHGASQFRFSWGQPDAAPRCADWAIEGQETCPATVPKAEEFQAELERLLAEDARTGAAE